jgi:pimeloyl-ACP methyl ester carboxylesterase
MENGVVFSIKNREFMLTEKTFTFDGYSMNYSESQQSGAPLVFLHGATLWWKDFEPLFQPLEKSWHVYTCDMRGHGKSNRTPGKYRAVDFASDVVAFIQKQIREPVVLVGHSNGGIIALLTAAQIPELVRAVILLDPAVALRNSALQSMLISDWVTGVGEILNSTRSVKEVVTAYIPNIDEAGLQETESMIRSVDPEFVTVMANNKFLDGLDLEISLSKITCPALLLYGELELTGIVRDSDVDFIKQYIPQTVAYQIRGAGHSPHWDQTDTTLEHITNFLKTI